MHISLLGTLPPPSVIWGCNIYCRSRCRTIRSNTLISGCLTVIATVVIKHMSGLLKLMKKYLTLIVDIGELHSQSHGTHTGGGTEILPSADKHAEGASIRYLAMGWVFRNIGIGSITRYFRRHFCWWNTIEQSLKCTYPSQGGCIIYNICYWRKVKNLVFWLVSYQYHPVEWGQSHAVSSA